MRRLTTIATSLTLAFALLTAPDILAQSRSTGSGSTTRSNSGSTTRSSGSVSQSSGSTTRSSGSTTRSSGTITRSSTTTTVTHTTGTPVRTSAQQDRRSTTSASRSSGSSQQQATRSSSSSGGSVSRSTGSSASGIGASRSSATTRSGESSSAPQNGVSSGTTVRSSGQSRSSQGVGQPASSGSSVSSSGTSRTAASGGTSVSGTTVRSSNVSRSGLTSNASSSESRAVQPTYRDDGYNYRYNDDMRVDDRHNLYRIPPRHRDPMPWDRPGYFWGDHPHYYGYRIHTPPPSWRRFSHWGIDYYYYNGIYYRPFGGVYVVCRPPFGTTLEAAINRAIFRAVTFAYYCDTYRTYSRTFDYYSVIARQNLIIAQQNARLVARNTSYALNANRALSAYELAEKLGLVQSYAYANSEYFYQDGVFYSVSASGVYSTIVPPAGALVSSLPDDYEIIVMNGVEYYLVDNTVYRTTLFEGVPYLEVLGQMYGSLYSQYNVYR